MYEIYGWIINYHYSYVYYSQSTEHIAQSRAEPSGDSDRSNYYLGWVIQHPVFFLSDDVVVADDPNGGCQ
jgi:hypothetical protein